MLLYAKLIKMIKLCTNYVNLAVMKERKV